MFNDIKSGVYKITNQSGKVYIGQSTNVLKRIHNYKKGKAFGQTALQNSFDKYGAEKHKYEVIFFCSINCLNKLERFYINMYKSNVIGLNLTSGGQDYFFHNEQVKIKMSLAQKGNTKRLGKKQTIDEIEKRRFKCTGLKRTDEQRQKISNSLKGKKRSDEQKSKMKGRLVNNKNVINTENGEIFLSAKLAALFLGIKTTTLIAKLNGQNSNNTSYKYI